MSTKPRGKVQPGEAPVGGSAASRAREPSERGASALDLQILSTEHSSLLATRSLSWSEAFSRANMFLSVLSAAVIALALMAQATAFGEGFAIFALVILPVVLFLGVATFVRLVAVNIDEARWVIGMNRLRGAYLDMAPHLERYFVTGHHDDARGIMVTAGWDDVPRLYGFVTTPAIVGVICAVLAGVVASLGTAQLGFATLPSSAVGAAAFVLSVVAALRYQAASFPKVASRLPPIDPTPADPT